MKGYLIFTGTELLLGKTLNSNSQYLGERLAELGIDVYKMVTLGDNRERIVAALNEIPKNVDLVILNGGLGPTEDDVTREALCDFLGIGEEVDPATEEKIRNRVKDNPLQGDLKVSLVPEGSVAFYNDEGVAPASLVIRGGRTFILTPGPPHELKHLLEERVIPYLKEHLMPQEIIHSRTLKFCGIGESKAEDKIRDLIRSSNPTVAPTIKNGEIHFRITAKGDGLEELRSLTDQVAKEIILRLEDFYFGEDDETLEGLVVQLLLEKEYKVAVAESCTGGLLSNTFTDISGSSGFFDRGYVTYSNESKVEELGIQPSTLEQYGAVSENTALEMAEGVWRKTGADLAISITGIAGPTGGTVDKPVGLVYIAFRTSQGNSVVTRIFNGDRLTFKRKVVKFILFEMYKKLKEKRS